MSAVPHWLAETMRSFGESLGLQHFAFGERNVAAMTFETGVALRFEYAYETLSVMLVVPTRGETAAIKRLLGYAHPALRGRVTVRTGYSAEKGQTFLVAKLPVAEVSLPMLNAALEDLWRLAEDFRNREP